jgi:hypothetical protein
LLTNSQIIIIIINGGGGHLSPLSEHVEQVLDVYRPSIGVHAEPTAAAIKATKPATKT